MKKYQAFSILEAALSILLIGIFASFIMPYWKLLNTNNNIIQTKLKANYIRKAIEGYVIRNSQVPYAGNKEGISQEGLLIGYLPYKTLGISKNYQYDGFGNSFTYIANGNLTMPKYKKNMRKNLAAMPIHIPQTVYPTFCCTYFKTFCRNYSYETRANTKEEWKDYENGTLVSQYTRIKQYDVLDDEKNIKIIKQNKEIKLGYIKIGKMLVKQPSFNLTAFHKETQWEAAAKEAKKNNKIKWEDLENNEAKNYDIIAWALISHRTSANKNKSMKIISGYGDLIFFQSRFNIAAQIKHPCTSAPINVSEYVIINEHTSQSTIID